MVILKTIPMTKLNATVVAKSSNASVLAEINEDKQVTSTQVGTKSEADVFWSRRLK